MWDVTCNQGYTNRIGTLLCGGPGTASSRPYEPTLIDGPYTRRCTDLHGCVYEPVVSVLVPVGMSVPHPSPGEGGAGEVMLR